MYLKYENATRRLPTQLLALLLLVAHAIDSSSATSAVFRLRDECTEIQSKKQCECDTILSSIEINCPADYELTPQIAVRIHPGSQVHIECYRLKDYTLLPNMSIGNNPMVQIKQCPLPGHTPIVRLLEHLGITQVNSLIFESSDLGINLTRQHLNGLQGLKRLRFSSKGLSHMPDDLFSELRNLTWLDLRSNNVELPVNLFEQLTNLIFLELGHNNLKQLPVGIFRNQHKMTQLNLWSNQLHNLTKNAFEGATSITDLDLSSNGLETLQRDVFSLLTNLSVINLSANHFRSLPEGLFAHNKNLSQIRLSNNRVSLTTLPSRLFANLPQFKEILLECDLISLPGDLFANSTGLTNVTISSNALTTLPSTLFADQFNLLDLNLQRNQLQVLPDELLFKAVNLKVLRLSHNQLTNISRDIFTALKSLEMLFLDNNRITTVDISAFGHTRELRYINMENNFINLSEPISEMLESNLKYDLNSPFANLENLQTLNLRNNSIMYIFMDWRMTLFALKELDLSYNNITSLELADLQFLTRHSITVNLSHNDIRSLYFEGIDSLDLGTKRTKLQIDLNANPLYCDCTLLSFVQFMHGDMAPELQNKLEFDTNALACAQPANLRGRDVHTLQPKELLCPFEEGCPLLCTCDVRLFDRVLVVNCNEAHNMTKVPRLPSAKKHGLNSTELYIENNNILQLPNVNEIGYNEVTKIYAAGNNLTTIQTTNLPKALVHLDVRRNQLTYLNESVVNFLNESRTLLLLELSQNQWVCDCSNKPLLQFTQNKFKLFGGDLEQMHCANMKDRRRFQEVTVNEICPAETSILIVLAIIVATTGFLIALLAAFYYKNQESVKLYLYGLFPGLFFDEEDLDKDKKFDAFVSYSQTDAKYVFETLMLLEKEPNSFRLCIHDRDWLTGGSITQQIEHSVKDSRRTIIVLSNNFIDSDWSRIEFGAAYQAALKEEGRLRLIVIVYGELDMDKVDGDLKSYITNTTYLRWDDPRFWEKLRYAMPHRKQRFNDDEDGWCCLLKKLSKGSTDDKLELVHPSPATPPTTTPPGYATKNPLVAHLNGGIPQTAIIIPNGNGCAMNGKEQNGHINGAFIINTNAKQSDV